MRSCRACFVRGQKVSDEDKHSKRVKQIFQYPVKIVDARDAYIYIYTYTYHTSTSHATCFDLVVSWLWMGQQHQHSRAARLVIFSHSAVILREICIWRSTAFVFKAFPQGLTSKTSMGWSSKGQQYWFFTAAYMASFKDASWKHSGCQRYQSSVDSCWEQRY